MGKRGRPEGYSPPADSRAKTAHAHAVRNALVEVGETVVAAFNSERPDIADIAAAKVTEVRERYPDIQFFRLMPPSEEE